MKLYLVTCHEWEAVNIEKDYDEYDEGTYIIANKAFVTKKSAEKCMKRHAKMAIGKRLDKMRRCGFGEDIVANAKNNCKCETTDDGLSITIPVSVNDSEYHYNYHAKELDVNL